MKKAKVPKDNTEDTYKTKSTSVKQLGQEPRVACIMLNIHTLWSPRRLILLVTISSVMFFCIRQAVSLDNERSIDVVTATVPYLYPRDSNPLAKDPTSQTPYVHWTCYSTAASDSSDAELFTNPSLKLHCCQAIFQIMVQEPSRLCWERDGCNADDKTTHDKTRFMHLCTETLAPIPISPRMSPPQPLYTLRLAPEGVSLKIHIWGQLVGILGSSSRLAVHWFHEEQVVGPLQLAPKARELLPDVAHPVRDESVFHVNLTTAFTSNDNNDDYFLSQMMRWWSKEHKGQQLMDHSRLEASIVVFLPEDIGILYSTVGSTSCTPVSVLCKSSCRVVAIHGKESAADMDQPNRVVVLKILVDESTHPACHDDGVTWKLPLVLADEDETYLLAAPVVQEARVFDSNENVVGDWDALVNMTDPLPIDVEHVLVFDRDEL